MPADVPPSTTRDLEDPAGFVDPVRMTLWPWVLSIVVIGLQMVVAAGFSMLPHVILSVMVPMIVALIVAFALNIYATAGPFRAWVLTGRGKLAFCSVAVAFIGCNVAALMLASAVRLLPGAGLDRIAPHGEFFWDLATMVNVYFFVSMYFLFSWGAGIVCWKDAKDYAEAPDAKPRD